MVLSTCLGDSLPWVPHVSTSHEQSHWLKIALEYLFKNVCTVKQHWNIKMSPSGARASAFTTLENRNCIFIQSKGQDYLVSSLIKNMLSSCATNGHTYGPYNRTGILQLIDLSCNLLMVCAVTTWCSLIWATGNSLNSGYCYEQ